MGHAYSKRFLGLLYTTTGASAVCPAGKVWVVKCVAIYFVSRAATDRLLIQLAGETIAYQVGATNDAGASQTWQGMAVLNAGEAINLVPSSGAQVNAIASGYELTA